MTVAPPDPRLYPLLRAAGFGEDVFNPRQHRACELVERYARAVASGVVDALGIRDALARDTTVDALLAATGFVPAFRPALIWLLDYVAAEVDVQGGTEKPGGRAFRRDSGANRVRRETEPRPLNRGSQGLPNAPKGPPPRLLGATTDALRAQILATDASYAPALALLDEAAAIYPRVARGETTGEQALFRRAALWFAYFSNEHGYYAINNCVAAAAAAERCRPGARVLEIGAGLGSATEALLARLGRAAASLATYLATEPVALFRRRAERILRAARPDVPFVFAALDMNGAWDVASGSFDLVWGVNVFHLARDLERVLAEARRALAPGGWLVAGEGLRPAPGRPVGVELPFRLLESFTDVELDPVRRPTPGFLTAEAWRDAFTRAGFARVTLVPDAIRVRALYPGFFAAAVCGQAG